MRLIRCKKCGSPIVTEEAFIERMQTRIEELTELMTKEKNGRKYQAYMQESTALRKMMVNIIHMTAQIEERKVTCLNELCEIVSYLRANHILTDEKIDELKDIGRMKAKNKNIENQREIDKVYGKYKSLYIPSNQTKADTTAKKAIRNTQNNTH